MTHNMKDLFISLGLNIHLDIIEETVSEFFPNSLVGYFEMLLRSLPNVNVDILTNSVRSITLRHIQQTGNFIVQSPLFISVSGYFS
jgi:hypothetical protein